MADLKVTNYISPDAREKRWYMIETNFQDIEAWAATIATNPGVPGGADTQVQYNNGGALGGISGVTSNGAYMSFADNIKLYFGTGDDSSVYYDGTDLYIDTQEDGSGNLIINNGDVGIGTAAPESKLHVIGDIRIPSGQKIIFDG